MSNIYAIANHKGGVGKTSTTLSLSAGLSRFDKRILMIDLDPQANLSQSVGIKQSAENTYTALKGQTELPIKKVSENLFIVPAHINLSAAELELSMEPGRENLLKIPLMKVQEQFDYIFIDCPPSLGLLTINALNASSKVLVPLQAHFLASQGLAKLIEIITKVKERLNPVLEIGGIILTMYKKHTILSRDIEEFTNHQFKNLVFASKIRDNIAIAEAPASGTDIFTYNSGSLGAMDYKNLCIEFIRRFE